MSVLANIVNVMVLGLYSVGGTTCGNNAFLPVYRLCSNDKLPDGNPVIFDGFYAKSLIGANNCTCVAKAKHKTAKKIKIENLQSEKSVHDCGSTVILRQPLFEERSFSCQIDDKVEMNINDTVDISIEIILRKEISSADTKYCFKMEIEDANVLDIKCISPGLTKPTTLDRFVPDYTTLEETNFDITTIANDTIDTTAYNKYMTTLTEDNASYKEERRQNKDNENSKTLYIAIGCGAAGLLVFVATVLCLVRTLRVQKGSHRQSDAAQEDSDEYGLQYNTLYVSSEDDREHQNTSNRQEEFNADVNQVVYQVEGNYGEIDLEEMPQNSFNRQPVSAIKETGIYDMNVDGDYSEIKLNEQVLPTISSKTDKHPKSNGPFGTGNKSFVNDSHNANKRENISTVSRVNLSGDGGCEYTVVEKLNDYSFRNDVYAVVDKTKKNI